MKNIAIVKTLAIAALSALTLLAGPSQARDWGQYERTAYTPERPDFDRPGFDHRSPGATWPSATGYNIDARQQRQMERIMHGLRSGEFSRQQARLLMREQKHIEQIQRQYLADNHLNRVEWLDLDHRLDRAAANIRTEKHAANWR